MDLRLHRPGPPLDRFVEVITYYAGYAPDHTKQRLLPDGAVEIIVDLTESPKKLYDRQDFSRARDFRKAWISGMRRDWIVIQAEVGASMVVIRFRPGGAYPFLDFAVEGLNDTVDHLDAVFGRATASLRDRILEASTVDAKIDAAEGWLMEKARGRLDVNPVVEYLTGRLFAPAGIRISDLVEDLGYSRRHVRNIFRKWVGLSPKEFGSLRRFQQVLTTLARLAPRVDPLAGAQLLGVALPEPDWADVAVAHGYYDQSHLIHDFRRYAGMTPREYAASFRGLENYLPVD